MPVGAPFPAQAMSAALITLRLLCHLAEHQHPPTPGTVPGKRVENKRKKQDFGKERGPAGWRAPPALGRLRQGERVGSGGQRGESLFSTKKWFSKTPPGCQAHP